MRRRFTTSAWGRTLSILYETSTPSFSNSRGTSVLGPTSVTRAPSLSSPKMLERATRLKRMSPMIATCRPAIFPLRSRIVYRSRRACVGCSCAPSPAFITLALSRFARNCGAPAELWRSTRISACNASRLRAVSLSVSPLVRLEAVAEMLMTSALRRNAASSNEVRVRVLGSPQKFTSVFPRSAGTFLISRVPICLNASAVSRTKLISSADNSRRPRRSLRVQRVVMSSSFFFQPNAIRFIVGFLQAHLNLFPRRGRQVFSNVIGSNWQLAMAACHTYSQRNARGTTKRIDCIHRGTRGATGIKDIIDDDYRPLLQRYREFRRVHDWQFLACAYVVTMH